MRILILLGFILSNYTFFAQDTAIIKTSAQCGSCKTRLEERIGKIKGVQSVDLDLDTKDLKVVFDKTILTSQKIEEKVTEVGYDANGKIAKKAAYKRLPACCRKDYKGEHH